MGSGQGAGFGSVTGTTGAATGQLASRTGSGSGVGSGAGSGVGAGLLLRTGVTGVGVTGVSVGVTGVGATVVGGVGGGATVVGVVGMGVTPGPGDDANAAAPPPTTVMTVMAARAANFENLMICSYSFGVSTRAGRHVSKSTEVNGGRRSSRYKVLVLPAGGACPRDAKQKGADCRPMSSSRTDRGDFGERLPRPLEAAPFPGSAHENLRRNRNEPSGSRSPR